MAIFHILGRSARAVRSAPGVLWGVYAANLLLCVAGVLPLWLVLQAVLDRSLAAGKLYHGFDLAAFIELATRPDVQLANQTPAIIVSAVLFALVMLFLSGGIIARYGRSTAAGEPLPFFEACAAFFWSFLRLALIFAVIYAALHGLGGAIRAAASHYADRSLHDRLARDMEIAALLVSLALLFVARIAADLGQAGAVAAGERRVRRYFPLGWRLLFYGFLGLFLSYALTVVVAGAVSGVLVLLWLKAARPESVMLAFVLLQGIALTWITARLWQRAVAVAWHAQYAPPVPIRLPEPIMERHAEPPMLAQRSLLFDPPRASDSACPEEAPGVEPETTGREPVANHDHHPAYGEHAGRESSDDPGVSERGP